MIEKDEMEIIGQWLFDGCIITGDDNEKRIDFLTSGFLTRIPALESGWDTL